MRFYLGLIFFLLSSSLFAQRPQAGEGLVIGKVISNASEKSIEYVAVKLYKQADSNLVTGVYTDVDGKFQIDQLPLGMYYLKIVLNGFVTQIISDVSVSSSIKIFNAGTIRFSLDKTQKLDEVTILGQTDMLKTGIDKKVYNVS